MHKSLTIFIATSAILASQPIAAQQQIQVPIADGVSMVSSDGACPEGSVRRTQVIGQQVAQQSYGQTIHYCVRTDRMPEGSGDQPPQLKETRAWPTLLPASSFGMGNSDVVPLGLTEVELGMLQSAVSQIRFANYRLPQAGFSATKAVRKMRAPLRIEA